MALSPKYRPALIVGAATIRTIFSLSMLAIDFGITLQITLMAILAHLGGVTAIACRRLGSPTAVDLALVRWGFAPLWVVAQVAARYAWIAMGRL